MKKVCKVLFSIIFSIIFIISLLLAIWFLTNGGIELIKSSFEQYGFWKSLLYFFKSLFN